MFPIFVGKRVFGGTTLNVAFTAVAGGTDPKITKVPVIGGHGGESFFSLVHPPLCLLTNKKTVEQRVMDGANEVILGKDGSGSAYVARKFCVSLLAASAGQKGVQDYAFVSIQGMNV
jgi:malate/lactate dehydrogenase